MRELIRFSLKKRFFNKMYLLFNILLFLVIGFVMNADRLIRINSMEIKTVCLDSSTQQYRTYLKDLLNDYQIIESDEKQPDDVAVLHLNRKWEIITRNKLDKVTEEKLEKAIRTAVSKQKYQQADEILKDCISAYEETEIISRYENETDRKNDPVWLIYSLIYFLIMSFSGVIANEILYEKSTHTLDLILTSLKAEEHFMAKILTGYLSLLIQGGCCMGMLLVWGMFRYLNDHFAGLISFIQNNLTEQGDVLSFNVSLPEVIVILISVFAGIFTLQTVLFVNAASVSNTEDASGGQAPFYLLLVIGYYLLLIYGDEAFMNSSAVKIMSLLPVSSMVFLPCRIIIRNITVLEIIVSLAVAGGMLLIIIESFLPVYKKRLLNQPRYSKKSFDVRKIMEQIRARIRKT